MVVGEKMSNLGIKTYATAQYMLISVKEIFVGELSKILHSCSTLHRREEGGQGSLIFGFHVILEQPLTKLHSTASFASGNLPVKTHRAVGFTPEFEFSTFSKLGTRLLS